MNTIAPDGQGQEGRTLLPSADSPEPEYEDGEDIATPRPIPPLPCGSRVNPHGVRRSAASHHSPGAPSSDALGTQTSPRTPHSSAAHSLADTAKSQNGGRAPDPTSSGHDDGGKPVRPAPATPLIGALGGAIALTAAVLAAIAPFVPFLSIGERLSLWGADAGAANAYVVLGASGLGGLGAIAMLTSARRRKRGLWGGLLSMVAGVAVGGIAAYLVMNADHRAVIAQGGTFGAAAWLIIASAGGLLIGGIVGLVHGTRTEGSR